MTKLVLGESEERPVIPDGEVLAVRIIKCEVGTSPFKNDDGSERQQVSFTFKVTEPGEFEDLYLFGNTPTTFTTHPDCKLRGWVEEILGGDALPVDFELDTDDLVNLDCRVRVGVRDRVGQDGKTPVKKNFVRDVLPAYDADLEPF